jgi:hypothetical protein
MFGYHVVPKSSVVFIRTPFPSVPTFETNGSQSITSKTNSTNMHLFPCIHPRINPGFATCHAEAAAQSPSFYDHFPANYILPRGHVKKHLNLQAVTLWTTCVLRFHIFFSLPICLPFSIPSPLCFPAYPEVHLCMRTCEYVHMCGGGERWEALQSCGYVGEGAIPSVPFVFLPAAFRPISLGQHVCIPLHVLSDGPSRRGGGSSGTTVSPLKHRRQHLHVLRGRSKRGVQ